MMRKREKKRETVNEKCDCWINENRGKNTGVFLNKQKVNKYENKYSK